MDAFAAHGRKFLQDRAASVLSMRRFAGAFLLATDILLVALDQCACRMDDDTLVIPETVNMRARLNENRIRQPRRQPQELISTLRIPNRQHGKPRFACGTREKLLVENASHR